MRDSTAGFRQAIACSQCPLSIPFRNQGNLQEQLWAGARFRRVPYFHFQVRTESHVLLTEGAELKGLDEARLEAARRTGDLLKEHAARIWADEDWQMDVTDEKGLILFVLMITAMKASATNSAGPVKS